MLFPFFFTVVMYCLNKYRFNENDFLAFLEFTDPIYEENRLILSLALIPVF